MLNEAVDRQVPESDGDRIGGLRTRGTDMGRKKLKHPKTQRHFSVAYMHLMDEVRTKLVFPGLQVSDGEMGERGGAVERPTDA